MNSATTSTGWHATRERGNRLILQLGLQVLRVLGYSFMHAWLHPMALYFCASSPALRRSSRNYFMRVQGSFSFNDAYRQVFLFAESALERVTLAHLGDQGFTLERLGFDEAERLAVKSGGVFLGAHFGSLEVAQQLNPTRIRTVPVGYPAGSKMFRELLQRPGQSPAEVLDVGAEPLELMMRAKRLVKQGVFLGMLGDRALPGMPEIVLPMLGRPARFPLGPYRLAAALRCPLIALFSVREGPRRHTLHTRVLSEAVSLPRRNREETIRALAQAYVAELERFCRRAPHQWYNFHDFWATAPA